MRMEREGIGNTLSLNYVRHTSDIHTHIIHIYTHIQTDRQTAVMGSSTEFSVSSTSTIRRASALYWPRAKVPLEHKVKHSKHSKHCNTTIVVQNICNRVALCSVRPFKSGFLWPLQMNNSTTEHDTTKLIVPFHSESTGHSIFQKYPKLLKIPLL